MVSELAKELASKARWLSPGDEVEIDLTDETAVRVKIEPDYDTSVNDYDCYGAFEWVSADPYHEKQRPAGFDGNAEKLHLGNEGQAWWQPPADVKRTDEGFGEFKDIVRDLLMYGFVGVVVERLDGEDHYGKGIVRDSASLWAIEAMVKEDFLAEVIDDLMGEVDIEGARA